MKKFIITTSTILICGLLAGLFWGVDYLYNYAVVPGEKTFLANGGQVTDEDVFSKWKFIEEDPVHYELMSRDGLNLKGVHLKHEKPSDKLAVVVHGYGNSSKGMSKYAKLAFDMGFDVFMPDARGHGDSEGDYIGFGWDERLDIVDWTNFLLTKYNQDVDVMLYGLSMGASTVMMASGEKLPEAVKVIIEDCGYDQVSNELSYQLKDMFSLPSFPLIPLASVYTDVKKGYNFYEASAVKQLEKNTLPMLFIHGTEDTFVPTSMIDKVYEATNGPKEKWLVEGAEHAESLKTAPKEYKEKVASFVNQYIPLG